jgi:hypothetical protein
MNKLLFPFLFLLVLFGCDMNSGSSGSGSDDISPDNINKFSPSNGEQGDNFGSSISLSSDGLTALIGAQWDGKGSAYIFIYNKDTSTWNQMAKLTSSDECENQHFGCSVSLSSDGLTALIGAEGDDQNGAFSGSAYIFQVSSWSLYDETNHESAKITPDDGAYGDKFGCSVSLSSDGHRALIGAIWDDNVGAIDGSAYVFGGNGSSWAQQAKITVSDVNSGHSLGSSVSLSSDGTKALIGARGNNLYPGSAYIFNTSGIIWNQQAKLTPSDGEADDDFGFSVSLSSDGSTALIGRIPYNSSGAAYIYESSSWDSYDENSHETAKLTPSDRRDNDHFGLSVSLSSDGEKALIGAFGGYYATGSAYIFKSTSWSSYNEMNHEVAKLSPPELMGYSFGETVLLSSNEKMTLIGSPREEEVYYYDSIEY